MKVAGTSVPQFEHARVAMATAGCDPLIGGDPSGPDA
jgi:hypothetical protein